MADHVNPYRRLVLAGMVDGRLGAYLSGVACGQTAYIDQVSIATEVLSTSIGTGLVFEFVEACRRGGFIREIVYGLHTPEDSSLCSFKDALGFPVRHVHSKVWMNPLAEKFIQMRYPHRYYRLRGKPAKP